MIRDLAGTVPGVAYKDRGRHEFKGWDERWRLYQIVWPGAPAPRPKERERAPRRWWIAAGVAALAAVIAAVIAIATSGGNDHPSLESIAAEQRRPHRSGLRHARPRDLGPRRPGRDRLARHGTLGRERRRTVGDPDRRANGQADDDPRQRPPDRDRRRFEGRLGRRAGESKAPAGRPSVRPCDRDDRRPGGCACPRPGRPLRHRRRHDCGAP